MSDIHTRIKELRTGKGLSMEALANLIGVKWQTIQQWERPDGTAPKRDRLQKVADALETTKTYLLDGEPTTPARARQVEQPTSKYQVKPHHTRPLVQTVCDLAEQISDDGLRELAGFARCLTSTHPLAKAKRA